MDSNTLLTIFAMTTSDGATNRAYLELHLTIPFVDRVVGCDVNYSVSGYCISVADCSIGIESSGVTVSTLPSSS